jgi:hypothetical protein
MAIVTLAEVKAILGITTAASDTRLQLVIDMVAAAMENECDRVFDSATYTEYYNHEGGHNMLVLRQWPLVTLTSVNVDTSYAWGSGTALTLSDAVTTDTTNGIVYRRGAFWTYGTRHIKVVYTAGYSTIPQDIKMAAYYWVGRVYDDFAHGMRGKDSMTIPGGQVLSLQSEVVPNYVAKILRKYKRLGA